MNLSFKLLKKIRKETPIMRTASDMLLSSRWNRSMPTWSNAVPSQKFSKTNSSTDNQKDTGLTCGCTYFNFGEHSIKRPRCTNQLHPSDLSIYETIREVPNSDDSQNGIEVFIAQILLNNKEIYNVCKTLEDRLAAQTATPHDTSFHIHMSAPKSITVLGVYEKRAEVRQHLVISGCNENNVIKVFSQASICSLLELRRVSPNSAFEVTDVEYRLILRNIEDLRCGKNFDTAFIPLKHIKLLNEHGFTNYFPPGKQCVHLTKRLPLIRAILMGNSYEALTEFIVLYAEIHPTIGRLWCDKSFATSIRNIVHNKEHITRHIRRLMKCKDENHEAYRRLMFDIATRGVNVEICNKILQRVIPESDLETHFDAISEIIFNTMCSLRLQKYGTRAVVGDLVCTPETSTSATTGSPYQEMTALIASGTRFIPKNRMKEGRKLNIKRITDEREAEQSSIFDVVLPVPVFFKPMEIPDAHIIFPSHHINQQRYIQFVELLNLAELLTTCTYQYRFVMAKAEIVQAVSCEKEFSKLNWLTSDEGNYVRLVDYSPRIPFHKTQEGKYLRNKNAACIRLTLKQSTSLWACLREIVTVRTPDFIRTSWKNTS